MTQQPGVSNRAPIRRPVAGERATHASTKKKGPDPALLRKLYLAMLSVGGAILLMGLLLLILPSFRVKCRIISRCILSVILTSLR